MTDEQHAPPAGDMTCVGCGNPLLPAGTCEAGCPDTAEAPEPQGAGRS